MWIHELFFSSKFCDGKSYFFDEFTKDKDCYLEIINKKLKQNPQLLKTIYKIVTLLDN